MEENVAKKPFGFYIALQLMRCGYRLRLKGHDGWIGLQLNPVHPIISFSTGEIRSGFVTFYNEDMSPCENQEGLVSKCTHEDIYSLE